MGAVSAQNALQMSKTESRGLVAQMIEINIFLQTGIIDLHARKVNISLLQKAKKIKLH